MNLSEALLVLFVAIVVFGPNKLPMVARHLSYGIKWFNRYKQQASLFWEEQVNLAQLQDNTEKAKQADMIYQNETSNQTPSKLDNLPLQ